MKWEPIETAPKDGTAILIWAPTEDPPMYVCIWRTMPYKNRDGSEISYWQEAGGEYYFGWDATHWMPLPDPPKHASPAERDGA